METIKCITFDKKAQDLLPEHIKAKMKAAREKAKKQCKCGGIFKYKEREGYVFPKWF